MIDMNSKLHRIEEQKKRYRILLNQSKYRQELQDQVWQMAAYLTSGFDLKMTIESKALQQKIWEGLNLAFQAVKADPKQELTIPFIQDRHTEIFSSLKNKELSTFRTIPARWLNSTMIVANWVKIPDLIYNLVDGINRKKIPAYYWQEEPDPHFQKKAYHPVIQAIEANYNTVAIHPFTDGNKRTARLISAWILDKYGHIPLTIYDREAYISSIENYCNTKRPHQFYETMLDQMEKSYDSAIQDAQKMETIYMPMRMQQLTKIKAKRSSIQQDQR